MNTPSADTDDPGRSMRLHSVLAQYLVAVDSGTPPNREAFIAQHSDLADDLRGYFANQDRLETAARAAHGEDCGTVDLTGGVLRTVADHERTSAGLTPGTVVRYFGDYELISELGRGGMGVVYQAKQRTLGRLVALKMMFAGELASDDDLRRFQNEAEAVAQLDHPNIVPIIEVGEHLGQKYFSMKLVVGSGLDTLRGQTVENPRLAATVVASVARAVHHAHQRGILHRDLKPSNVLIDAQHQPHVTDFGLSKRVESDSAITRSGAIMGTPSYMAPEQASGEKGLVTTASDVYGLGAILYDLLTGAPPFRGESVLETLIAVREQEVAAIRPQNARVDCDLETIALTCLNKDPKRRYATAEALADDLDRWLNGEPIQARPVSSLERSIKWARRRPAIAGLAALVVFLTLGGLAGISLLYVQATRNARMATEERRMALAAEARARESAEQAEHQRDRAQSAQDLAEQLARKEGEAKAQAEKLLYFNQINLARQYWLADSSDQADKILAATAPSQRQWEWRYLSRSFHPEVLTLDQFATSLEFSRDGRRMAAIAIGGDAGVVIWDMGTRKPLCEVNNSNQKGKRHFVTAALSHDGQVIALGEQTGAISLWDATTGKHLSDLATLEGKPNTLNFSPNGKLLAAARNDSRNGSPLLPILAPSRNESLRVFEVATGKAVFSPPAGVGVAAVFSPDGKRLLGFKKNLARLLPNAPEYIMVSWNAEIWMEERTLGPFSSWSFSADGKRLALGGQDGSGRGVLKLVDAETGSELVALSPTRGVGDLSLNSEGNLLAVAIPFTPFVDIWNVRERKFVQTLRGHTKMISGILFQPGGRRLATCSWDCTIKFWDVLKDPRARALPGKAAIYASEAAISPSVEQVAIVQDGVVGPGSPTKDVVIWNLEQGKAVHVLKGHASGVQRLAYAGNGSVLASGGRDFQVRTWDAATGHPLATFQEHKGLTQSLAMSPDGRLVASTHEPPDQTAGRTGKEAFVPQSGEIKVWDARTGVTIWTLAYSSTVYQVAFAPDGETLLASGGSGLVSRWNLKTGQPTSEIPVQANAGMSFSRDGKLLALISPQETRILETVGYKVICTLRGQFDQPSRIAFSPDGSRAVTYRFNEVKLWAIPSGQEVITLPVLDPVGLHGLAAIAFSPDGRRIIAVGRSGESQSWDSE